MEQTLVSGLSIEVCPVDCSICLCRQPSLPSANPFQFPVQSMTWIARFTCGASGSFHVQNVATPIKGAGSSAIQVFAVRYNSGTGVWPDGRDVFHWYAEVDTSNIPKGGLCSPGAGLDQGMEFITGVTTSYIQICPGGGPPVTMWEAFDFSQPLPPLPQATSLTISQSDWTNHHDPNTNQPVYGIATLGTIIFSGIR